eukprot:SAG31_NODE_183_length_20987_cov_8.711078_4_plen_60_part_00
MNFAEYAVRRPFESHWEMYVTHRLGEAQASLDRMYVLRTTILQRDSIMLKRSRAVLWTS